MTKSERVADLLDMTAMAVAAMGRLAKHAEIAGAPNMRDQVNFMAVDLKKKERKLKQLLERL